MGIGKWKTQIKEVFGKYKYVLLILLVGMLFLMQPEKETAKETVKQTDLVLEEPELREQLEDILKNIQGAGEVMVMLSVQQGEHILYQTDTTDGQTEKSTDSRSQTVLITDGQRNETGLIRQKNPPVYQGAIILAQGADQPAIKLAIAEAVSKVTGLGTNKISVLKMK